MVVEYAVVPRTFVAVDGPDAESYLQGQLSQDVVAAPSGLSFLLEPTGKVCALLRYVRTGPESFVLDTDAAAGDALLGRLRRFLLRTKATIEPVELVCTRVFGGPRRPEAQATTVWSDHEPRPVELVGPRDDVPPAEAVALDPEEHERRRIEAGVPVCGVDIGPETIPAEVGSWAIAAAVSFTKGCFTGQELVARIDSRGGHVPRPLRVLELDAPVDAGATVVGPDGSDAGTVTSAARGWALAPLPRRVDVGAEVVVDGVAGVVVR